LSPHFALFGAAFPHLTRAFRCHTEFCVKKILSKRA
jgi:hypothetical protein